MQYLSCKYLQSNPKVFDYIYNQLKSGEIKIDPIKINIPTKNNFKDYLTYYIHSAMEAFEEVYSYTEQFVNSNPKLKSILDNPDLTLNEKLKKAQTDINKYISSKHTRNHLMENINYYLVGLKKYLPCDEKFLSKQLKDILSDSISSIARELSSLNLFEKYRKIESNHFTRMNFKEFISGNKRVDIANPETLRNMPIHDLMILNSFWINRYAKELSHYSDGIFLIKTLNLLPEILDNKFNIRDIDKNDLETTLIKSQMLHEHAEHFINCQQEYYYTGKMPNQKYKLSEDGNHVTYSFVPFAKQLKIRYSSEYKFFFDQLLPKADNDIGSNAILYAKLASPIINIYDTKDEILNSLISNLENNPDIVNAGLIPDSISNDGTQIMLNPNYVCLGLDAKLTFPVREHIKLTVLKDFLVSLQNGNEYIPIYNGDEDFNFHDGKNISAQQILPFTKEQEKLLKKVVATNPEGMNKDFILHLNWLRDPSKIPEKFKSTIIDSKGRKKKSFIRKYVNLDEYEPDKPLQIYIKKDNEYVKITNKDAISFSSTINSSKESSNKPYNGGEDIEL